MEADRVRPRWFGHDMSGVLDSGIGRTQYSFRPTSPQLVGRKRRASDQLVSGAGVGVPGSREGALRGTPHKRVLFGSDGPNSISSGSDVPEGRSGLPPDSEYPVMAQFRGSPEDDCREETRSPRIKLEYAVLQLQKDLEEVRAESRYCNAGWPTTPARYAGRSSWDQYRHVFEAIVCSNGWDEVTAALQLVAHLEGDALNVALPVEWLDTKSDSWVVDEIILDSEMSPIDSVRGAAEPAFLVTKSEVFSLAVLAGGSLLRQPPWPW